MSLSLCSSIGWAQSLSKETLEKRIQGLNPKQTAELQKRIAEYHSQTVGDFQAISSEYIELQKQHAYLRRDLAVLDKRFNAVENQKDEENLMQEKAALEAKLKNLDATQKQNRTSIGGLQERYESFLLEALREIEADKSLKS